MAEEFSSPIKSRAPVARASNAFSPALVITPKAKPLLMRSPRLCTALCAERIVEVNPLSTADSTARTDLLSAIYSPPFLKNLLRPESLLGACCPVAFRISFS